jgi:TP901 family phage tail tape measure protein
MSTDLAVFVKIMGKDGITPEYKKLDKSTMRLAQRTNKSFRSMNKSAMSFSKLVGGISFAGVLRRGFSMMEMGVRAVGQEVVDLDQSLQAASAKFGGSVKRGTDAFDQMEAQARKVGATTEFTAAEAAKGLDFLAMAGFDYGQAMKAIVPLTDLATAAQMDLARASDIASDALGAFGLSMDPDEIETSMNRVNDVFAQTVTSSNTTMETLFETMQQAGPAVKTAGGELETFAALAGKLGSAGIKGSIAGTNLKNMFLRLAAPVGKSAKLLKKLRVETVGENGNMRDMIDIIGDLNAATENMGTAQRAAALDTLFGKRAISGASVLLDIGKDKLKEYRKELENAQGASKEMAGEMRKGLGVQLKVLQSTLTEKGLDLFTQMMGEEDPAEAIAKITDEIRKFDVGPLARDMRELFGIMKEGAKFLWENRDAIMSIGKAWMIWKATGVLSGLGQGAVNVGNMATNMGKLGTSVQSATGLVGGLKMAIQNIGPLIAAFGGGYAAGTALYEIVDSRLDKLERQRNKVLKKRVRADVGIGQKTGGELVSDINELSRQRKEALGGFGSLEEIPTYNVEQRKEVQDLERILGKLRAASSDRAQTAAAGGTGMFADRNLQGVTEFIPELAMGAQSAPIIEPSFDVFINTSVDKEGNAAVTDVTVAPKVQKNKSGEAN